MRILKNRGDIFFSKSNKEKSLEQKILLLLLLFIVLFTIVFLVAVGIKNDFSPKKFFAPDNLEVSAQTAAEEELPVVSGRSNFIFLLHHKKELLFTTLVQVDMDNVAYKVSCLKSATQSDGKSLADIYRDSGMLNVKNAVESLLNADFDYYISMEYEDFVDFYDMLGSTSFPVVQDIKFRDTKSSYGYSIKMKAGEQKIKGAECANLVRYFLDEENNTALANDVILNSLASQINEENYEKSEDLFKKFITAGETNITVRDFSSAGDKFKVLSNERTAVRTYNSQALYKKNKIENKNEVKGYFVK